MLCSQLFRAHSHSARCTPATPLHSHAGPLSRTRFNACSVHTRASLLSSRAPPPSIDLSVLRFAHVHAPSRTARHMATRSGGGSFGSTEYNADYVSREIITGTVCEEPWMNNDEHGVDLWVPVQVDGFHPLDETGRRLLELTVGKEGAEEQKKSVREKMFVGQRVHAQGQGPRKDYNPPGPDGAARLPAMVIEMYPPSPTRPVGSELRYQYNDPSEAQQPHLQDAASRQPPQWAPFPPYSTSGQQGKVRDSINASQVQAMSIEDKWQLVVDRPDLWWDNRSTKTNPKAPDFAFKDKSARVSLWQSNRDTPAWAKGLPNPLPPPSAISQQSSPSPPAASPSPPEQHEDTLQGSIDASQVQAMSIEDKWQLVVGRPDLWWDNRSNKKNPRAPDFVFKDKSANVALWQSSRDTPAWAKDLPEPLPPPSAISQKSTPSPQAASPSPSPPEQQREGAMLGKVDASQVQAMGTEDKWQLVVDRPDLWWDNRSNKKNPRAPDFTFKDKSVNMVLWQSSRDTPAWAKDLPEPLPPPSAISQQSSPSPTAASPSPPEQHEGATLGKVDASQVQAMSVEDKWQLVVERPDLWWDNRSTKTNPKAPDFAFKDKSANVVLWQSNRDTPAWAKDLPDPLPPRSTIRQQSSPSPPAASPSPPEQQNEKAPQGHVDASQVQAMSVEDKWQLVVDRPDLWWDNRSKKNNPRAPDFVFKDKSASVALWLSSKGTPAWVKERFLE